MRWRPARADPERERLEALLKRLEGYQPASPVPYAERVSVDRGQGGMDLIEVSTISHFVARGKATLAMTAEGARLVNHSLGELENRLDPRKFARIHRNAVVNLDWVQRVEPPRGGGAGDQAEGQGGDRAGGGARAGAGAQGAVRAVSAGVGGDLRRG